MEAHTVCPNERSRDAIANISIRIVIIMVSSSFTAFAISSPQSSAVRYVVWNMEGFICLVGNVVGSTTRPDVTVSGTIHILGNFRNR